jgi:hypothetical protein
VVAALAVTSLAGASGLGASPAGAGDASFCEETEATAFVCGSYLSFFRRNPSESETDYWAAQLPAKTTVFVSTLGKSAESRRRMIGEYYHLFADRDAGDLEGVYWEGEVLKPNGFRRLEAALYNELDIPAADLVDWAFYGLVGRDPSMAEVTYWGDRAEATTYGQMATALGGTPEARNARVRWTYRNELGYFPSTANRDYWANRLKTGTSYLELRIALKAGDYPESSETCSAPAPVPFDWCK